MPDRRSSGFKISEDDQRPDSLLRKPRKNKRVEQPPGRGGVILCLLLILLVGGALAYTYLDTRQQMELMQTSGTARIQKTIKELEERFSSLSGQYAKLEESLTKKVFPMDEIFLALESSTDSIEKKLKKAEETIVKLDETKAEKQETTQAVEEITKTITPLMEELKTLASDLAALKEQLTKEVLAINDSTDESGKQIEALKKEISAISGNMADIKSLDKIKSQNKKISDDLKKAIAKIKASDNNIASLKKRISKVEKQVKKRPRTKPASTKKPVTKEPVHPIDALKLEPGSIIEDDIE
ncbi:hypothetical protein QUF76_14070 [Desulfobacterales bacterium HSG16]|nr:hypothetical protein [Desulfobacterales bacterium HSG16]